MTSAATDGRRAARKALLLSLMSAGLFVLAISAGKAPHALAVIEQIYTLPFEGIYDITCPFGPYSQCPGGGSGTHYGTDYQLGDPNVGDHPVLAAKRGTVKVCPPEFPGAGYYIAINHGNGHNTRYLHLSRTVVTDGQTVERGAVVAYEGNSGTSAFHLHFETRHGAGTFTCLSGTAVDPYYSGTYMWRTNPPSMRGADWNGDGCADVLARWTSNTHLYMYRGNCAGGFVPGDPIQIGTNWGGVNWMIRPGDFSGDGCPDILARWSSDSQLYLYKGNCAGGFIPGGPGQAGTGSWAGVNWIDGPGDFSRDGCPDVLARWSSDSQLYLYRGNCAGGFIPGGPSQAGTGSWAGVNWIVGPGDFSGDGCPDILARWSSDSQLYLYKGNCAGGFIPGGPSQAGTGSWAGVNWIASAGDFSAFECADVLARWTSNTHLYMYRGNCAGGFIPGGPSQAGTGSWAGVNWVF